MIQKIAIVGIGKVGRALAKALKNSGFDVIIYNRTYEKALALAEEIRVGASDRLADMRHADLIILTVSDDAIESVFHDINGTLGNTIIVHTSGTQSIERLSDAENYGLFYPLDSFGYHGDWEMTDTPIFVEGNRDEVERDIKTVAYKISRDVHVLDEKKRQWLHLAAVLTNNFTNRLLAEAQDLLTTHQIPEASLNKLLQTTIKKAITSKPEKSQTGPAHRGDMQTIQHHLSLLESDDLKQIYKLISLRINQELNF